MYCARRWTLVASTIPRLLVQGLAYIYGAANSGNRRCDLSGPGGRSSRPGRANYC